MRDTQFVLVTRENSLSGGTAIEYGLQTRLQNNCLFRNICINLICIGFGHLCDRLATYPMRTLLPAPWKKQVWRMDGLMDGFGCRAAWWCSD